MIRTTWRTFWENSEWDTTMPYFRESFSMTDICSRLFFFILDNVVHLLQVLRDRQQNLKFFRFYVSVNVFRFYVSVNVFKSAITIILSSWLTCCHWMKTTELLLIHGRNTRKRKAFSMTGISHIMGKPFSPNEHLRSKIIPPEQVEEMQ